MLERNEPALNVGSKSYADVNALLTTYNWRGFSALAELGEALSAAAPAVAGILRSSAIRAAVESYTRLDIEAVRQQSRLMKELNTANICLMITGVLSGIVLVAPKIAKLTGWASLNQLSLLLGGLTISLGALAVMFTYNARENDRLGRWMNVRAAAEMARIAGFRGIAGEAAEQGPASAGGALALLRAFLLDDQRGWLKTRAAEHRRSFESTAAWGGVATALAFIGGSGAVISSFLPDQSWIALAGVIGAAVAAYAVNREALRRDRANADRYEKAAMALDALAGRFDAVASEVFAGRRNALTAYASSIADLLANEHKQWLDGTAQANAVIERLDADLRKTANAESS